MSVLVERDRLTKDVKMKINRDLTISIEKGKGKHAKTDFLQCYLTTPTTVRLPLNYAVNVLDCTNDDLNHFRPQLKFTGELRGEQPDIIENGLNKLAQERSFTLIASTGIGKTVVGAWFSCRLGCITCVLIDRTNLIVQWKGTASKFTNSKVWVVGEEPPPEEGEQLPEFIVCMNMRINKIPEYIRRQISLLIIDEAHKFCTKNKFDCMMYFNPIYVISMTATPNRTDGAFEIIHKLSGVPEKKYASNKRINVYRIDTPLEYSRVTNVKTGELDWTVIDEELHFHPDRNSMLINLILNNLHRKIMVFSGRVAHVDLLMKALEYHNVKCDYMSGSKKTYSDSNVLVGTTSKMGTGFDEAAFCQDFGGKLIDMIIIFNSYKSLIQLEQNIGRSRADFPDVYHFVDKDSIIYRQWLELRGFYLDPECSVRANINTITVESNSTWPFDFMGEWLPDIVNDRKNAKEEAKEEEAKEEEAKEEEAKEEEICDPTITYTGTSEIINFNVKGKAKEPRRKIKINRVTAGADVNS